MYEGELVGPSQKECDQEVWPVTILMTPITNLRLHHHLNIEKVIRAPHHTHFPLGIWHVGKLFWQVGKFADMSISLHR